ncbi:SDR family NAD(P)-dependent oxidoreductase [Ruegeria pomeroyi]|jgi:short-subunit dehydrogenase|uniref:Oxidoreductase, short-chain dehydrogenase/reductase family n=2 Tax=Ruegeria pomeroyi TaxID=89184 RepID=Q5LTD4_RUEPO|nr:SDR family NAD(P)-dependent oxidoreductase [Ruegeria pomeroyi]HCE71809.1 KR domain-containing protein [Ruegeria sp.]AAV94767.1 oxidoreductase, short-chain dehydrogenase/reductase family [Ruegeria pomeroyi DSS-3]NVK95897.1 SDR family NAD(P)-dependent oxidoreductase [Ruegeria pomeroyi]NVL00124.1 SDR family NAD(P)-dependent oxidoreductase [Ruegeria pomeroyi]QWV08347.1 SDR family NAD(P)-dependent oxidoreductase [Ruegeria pomeroyi]
MTQFSGKTFWLIGASEGLGRALAKRLDGEGARVILSARNGDRLEQLRDELQNALVVPLDVTDTAAVQKAAASVGPLDGVIYNAGAYEPMRATDWDSDAALRMSDVNFTGALRVLGEVVPGFVRQGRGDITLVGSLAGYRGLPAAIGYGASKAALVSLAETMRFDLKGTGITVRLVNPGFIKTRLTAKNSFRMPMLMTPETAAEHVLKAMRKRRFRTDFPAPFSWAIRCMDYLPDILVYRGR